MESGFRIKNIKYNWQIFRNKVKLLNDVKNKFRVRKGEKEIPEFPVRIPGNQQKIAKSSHG